MGTGGCKYAVHASNLAVGEIQTAATIQVIALLAFWIIMHFGGAVIRSILYYDPYLLDPFDPTANKVLNAIVRVFGPWLVYYIVYYY